VCMRENDPRRRAREVTLLLDILSELTMSLKNDNTEETRKRRSIYASLQEMIVRAHVSASAETFETVESTLLHLLEGWKAICRLLEGHQADPAMSEEQTVEEGPVPSCPYLEAMSPQNGPASRGWTC
jgi:flagellin-specific chaperone FliS